MIFTSRMTHLTAVVLRSHSEEVARALLRCGVVQFNRLAELSPSLQARLQSAAVGEQSESLGETRRRIEAILKLAGYPTPVATGADLAGEPVDLPAVAGKLESLGKDVERHRKKQAELQHEINRIGDMRRQLVSISRVGGAAIPTSVSDSATHRYLDFRTGRIRLTDYGDVDRKLGRVSGMLLEVGRDGDSVIVLVISMKRNSSEVSRILQDHSFAEVDLPNVADGAGEDALAEADRRLARLRADQAEQNEQIAAVVSERRTELERDWKRIRFAELVLTIRGNTSESDHATVFTGWVPVRQRERVERSIQTAADGACVLEWHTASDMEKTNSLEPPVELDNPRFLKPFQMLVTNYGIPEYGTIDPTPLVAISFLLMFGLMFGDAGHGAVLILLGVLGRNWVKTPNMKQLARLLTWCGGASVVAGVMFGAYFGFELLPPLWFDYHGVVAGHVEGGAIRNLMDILTITIFLGVTVIAAGLVLNWINLVIKRDWRRLIFDKTGLLGGIMYGTGVWMSSAFAASGFRQMPGSQLAFLVIGVSALLLFLKFPLAHVEQKRREREPAGKRGASDGQHASSSPFMWVMEWVIELLEVFSGYLANTLSFMRVAGLGIAHVMLMVAFYQIATMITPDVRSIPAIVVLVVGNVIVIALEGLSAGIQSLRLNYYEFFSKYFSPTGSLYRPVSLDMSQ
jgi:V/A-type H+/Na+-transporting ATPase subunit I